jgi:predicted TIM-barrel fold metal-dependent hydrolase
MTVTTSATREQSAGSDLLLISADSHVIERPELWEGCMPASFWPGGTVNFEGHPGGFDPQARIQEMAQDGVSAEVLFPSLALALFSLAPEQADVQERAFRIYNDWIVQFCQADPERLIGTGLISVYDIDHAIAELQRCRDVGLKSVMIWEVPHPTLPFSSRHYDPFWEAAQDVGIPVGMHILSGHSWGAPSKEVPPALEFYRTATNIKLMGILQTLYDVMFSGALDRFPGLKLVLVENEIGWLPWMLQIWDRYYHRSVKPTFPDLEMQRAPSQIFRDQVYATFFEDAVGASLLGPWGVDNCMWSNDYPHHNSTWPNSRQAIAKDLAHLSDRDRVAVLSGNVCALYGLTPPSLLTV